MNKNTCTDCLLDDTDVCSKGADRTVDNKICKDFIRLCTQCPEYDTINGNCPLYCKFIRETLQECLITELEQIKEEMSEYKEFQDGHFIDAAQMKYALMYVVDTHLYDLRGDLDENF